MGNIQKKMTNTPLLNREEEGGDSRRALGKLATLSFLFFTMSGGPIGIESMVSSYGPIVALIGSIVYPMVCQIPLGLLIAEYSSAFPKRGGYVYWVKEAFGDRVSFFITLSSFVQGCGDSALYPVLFADYTQKLFHGVFDDRIIYGLRGAFVLLLLLMMHRGLRVSGAILGVGLFCVILPLLGLSAVASTQFDANNLLLEPTGTSSSAGFLAFVSTMYWNFSGQEACSSLSGDIKHGKHYSNLVTMNIATAILSNIFPLTLAAAATPGWRDWSDGSLVSASEVIGGRALGISVFCSVLVSTVGMFVAEVNEDTLFLVSLGDRGIVPKCFRNKPVALNFTVLFTTSMIVLNGNFSSLLGVVNILNCFNLLVVIAASLWLRSAYPDLPRPYRIPLGNVGLGLVMTPVICTTTMVLVSTLVFDSRSALGFIILLSFLFVIVCFVKPPPDGPDSPSARPLITEKNNPILQDEVEDDGPKKRRRSISA